MEDVEKKEREEREREVEKKSGKNRNLGRKMKSPCIVHIYVPTVYIYKDTISDTMYSDIYHNNIS